MKRIILINCYSESLSSKLLEYYSKEMSKAGWELEVVDEDDALSKVIEDEPDAIWIHFYEPSPGGNLYDGYGLEIYSVVKDHCDVIMGTGMYPDPNIDGPKYFQLPISSWNDVTEFLNQKNY